MGEQCIAAIKNVCHGIDLMGAKPDFRVHAHKIEVTAVIFTGTVGVEFLVVEGGKPCSAFRVRPNPVLERLLEKLLFALGNGGFFLVEDGNLFSIIQYRGACERGQKANITVPTGLPAVSGTLGNAATPASHTPLFFLSERNPGYTVSDDQHGS